MNQTGGAVLMPLPWPTHKPRVWDNKKQKIRYKTSSSYNETQFWCETILAVQWHVLRPSKHAFQVQIFSLCYFFIRFHIKSPAHFFLFPCIPTQSNRTCPAYCGHKQTAICGSVGFGAEKPNRAEPRFGSRLQNRTEGSVCFWIE